MAALVIRYATTAARFGGSNRFICDNFRPGQILSYIKVRVGATLATPATFMVTGVLLCSMKGSTQFNSRPCPDCGEETGVVNLGGEPPREVCGRFGCDWDGITLRPDSPAREETDAGVIVE